MIKCSVCSVCHTRNNLGAVFLFNVVSMFFFLNKSNQIMYSERDIGTHTHTHLNSYSRMYTNGIVIEIN